MSWAIVKRHVGRTPARPQRRRAALITRGLAEITRFGVALGARAETFRGLTGMGDLILTATGDLSRNRKVGLALGRDDRRRRRRGTRSRRGRCALGARRAGRARQLDVDMPITEAVCAVLDGVEPADALHALLARSRRSRCNRRDAALRCVFCGSQPGRRKK